MKTCLILVLSSDFGVYSKMIRTSLQTWDSIEISGVETIFYTSKLDNPDWVNTDKVMYFDTGNGLFDMGYKNLAVFEWALANKEFDYVARFNASQYCDKKELIKYVQGLPDSGLFSGVEADSVHGRYCWGGCGYIISKDVIKKIVDNKGLYRHDLMEDQSLSQLVNKLGTPFTNGIKSCSIDSNGNGWHCISYCGESLDFTDFNDLKNTSHFCYRVKQDGKRWLDEFLMLELFKILQ